jgi:hypothetical protein
MAKKKMGRAHWTRRDTAKFTGMTPRKELPAPTRRAVGWKTARAKENKRRRQIAAIMKKKKRAGRGEGRPK